MHFTPVIAIISSIINYEHPLKYSRNICYVNIAIISNRPESKFYSLNVAHPTE